jgi:hypothetical protein
MRNEGAPLIYTLNTIYGFNSKEMQFKGISEEHAIYFFID